MFSLLVCRSPGMVWVAWVASPGMRPRWLAPMMLIPILGCGGDGGSACPGWEAFKVDARAGMEQPDLDRRARALGDDAEGRAEEAAVDLLVESVQQGADRAFIDRAYENFEAACA